MALHKIVHKKQSTVPDSSNTDLVRASDWNDDHSISWGFATPNKIQITSADGVTAGDALFDKVHLLMSADSNAGNTNFVDYSGKNLTLISSGGAAHSSYTSKWGTTSARFDGIDDYVSGTLSQALGVDDFCIEAWIMLDPSMGDNAFIFDNRPDDSTGFVMYVDSVTNSLSYWWNATTFTNSYPIAAGQWTHVCLERLAGVMYAYVNGVRVAAGAYGNNITTKTFKIGHRVVNNGTERGLYMQDLRVTIGSVRYTQVQSPYGELLNPAASDFDPYWDNVIALMHFNGQNNGTLLVDEKLNAWTITGDCKFSTAQSKFNGSSLYFNGSGDYLSVAKSTTWDFGSSDFTIDAWVYLTSSPVEYRAIFSTGKTLGSDYYSLRLGVDFNGKLGFAYSTNGTAASGIPALAVFPLNQWVHVAAVRSGGTMYLFQNGVLQGTNTVSGNIYYSTSDPVTIGTAADYGGLSYANNKWIGYMQDFRVTKGAARYTTAFTPSSLPCSHGSGFLNQDPQFAAVGSLIHMSRRADNGDAFRDDVSLNMRCNDLLDDTGKTITTTGSPVIAPSAGAITTKSAISLPTGSYLSVPSEMNFNGDFTIEFWFKITAFSATACTLFDSRASGLADGLIIMAYPAGNINYEFRYSGGATSAGGPGTANGLVQTNTWYHYALTKSGNTFTTWLNGVNVGTTTGAYTFSNTTARIGYTIDSNASYAMNGYMDDIRVTKACRYTSTFTPPTSEIPSVSSRIYDSKGRTLTLNGDVAINKTQFKFNDASAYFDGTGDSIVVANHADLDVGSGDFTMEAWVYLINSGADVNRDIMVFSSVPNIGVRFGNSGFGYKLQCGCLNATATCYSTSWTQSTFSGKWRHVAFTRSSGKMMLFVDGVQQMLGSGANPSTYSNSYFTDTSAMPAGSNLTVSSNSWYGYMQDLRVTKGYARYTSSFQTPTRQFPDVIAPSNVDNWWRGVSLYAKFNDTTDSSAFANTLTMNGSATIDTTLPKFGTGCLILNDGGWVVVPASSSWNFGSKPFTVECWIKTSAAKDQAIVSAQTDASTGWSLRMNAAGKLTFYAAGETVVATGITSINTDTWTHVSVSKVNGVIYLHVNGAQDASAANSTACLSQGPLLIGRVNTDTTSKDFLGRMDDVRVTTGTGRYAGAFTAPTSEFYTASPYDASYMTSSGPVGMWALDDVSGSTCAASVGSAASISGTSYVRGSDRPSEYSVWNKSTYLNSKTSDTRIVLSNTTLYTAFTLEFVFNLDDLSSQQHIASKNSYYAAAWTDSPFAAIVGTNGSITVTASQGNDYTSDLTLTTASGLVVPGTWYHVAFRVANNGAVVIWLNGAIVAMTTIAFSLSPNTQPWTIGGPAQAFSGGVGIAGAQGKFCGVALYSRELTKEEVYDHYIMSGVNPRASSNYSYGVNQKLFTAPINKHLKQLPGLTLDAGMNFTSVGPVEITDVDVTIPQGSSWVIL